MILPPPPALIACALLLGWPLIQLGSVLWVRDARSRMRTLADELRAAMTSDPDALAEVDRIVADSHGHPMFVIFPFTIPPAIVAASLWELFGRDRPSRFDTADREMRRRQRRETLKRDLRDVEDRLNQRRDPSIPNAPRLRDLAIYKDPRYRALLDLSSWIGLARWPVSLGLTVVLSTPFLPLYLVAYGLRETVAVIPRLARQFAVTFRIASPVV